MAKNKQYWINFQAGCAKFENCTRKSVADKVPAEKTSKEIIESFISGVTLQNFLYSHVSYVSPDIIFVKKNVAILHNTSKFVVLTMSPTHANIYNFTR